MCMRAGVEVRVGVRVGITMLKYLNYVATIKKLNCCFYSCVCGSPYIVSHSMSFKRFLLLLSFIIYHEIFALEITFIMQLNVSSGFVKTS